MLRKIAVAGVSGTMLMLSGCQNHSTQSAWNPFGPPIEEDQSRNVYIPGPADQTGTVRVGAVYNDTHIQIRYEFETDNPSWLHDYLVYRKGQWQTLGSGAAGPAHTGLYEDRISVALNNNTVNGFDIYGGYVTMHPGVVGRTDEADEEIGKFIAGSREDAPARTRWRLVLDEDRISRMQDRGEFLTTWQWRAHRSNPIGYADPGYVLEARNSASGRSMYETNWNDNSNQPLYMYDPESVGFHALDGDRVTRRDYGQDELYYLSRSDAKPFDPNHNWKDGDALPRRYLRTPSGHRGELRASGRWSNGVWRVSVQRTLESPDPREGLTLSHGQTVTAAFAVHTGATQGRWHLVSLPLRFGIGAEADLTARYTSGELADASVEWTEVPLFYAGQVYLDWLQGDGHPVHDAYQRALRDPLNPSRIRELAAQLVKHERDWLREQHASQE